MLKLKDPSSLDLTEYIRPGDTVIWSQGPGEPMVFTEALIAQRHRLGGIRAFVGSTYSRTILPEHADAITFFGIGGVGATQHLLKAKALKIVPTHLSQLSDSFANGRIKIDVAFVQVSPANEDGTFSYGAVCSYLPDAVKQARVVIAEINALAPRTLSRARLDPNDIDMAVEVSRPLLPVPMRETSDVDRAIADRIAPLVADGDTLQIGIGSLPDAVLSALASHRDLGLHSGTVGDGVVRLIEAGVITNARKPIDTGVSVTGGLFGTECLNKFAHDNDAIRVDPVSYTHNAETFRHFDTFVSINSSIEVDLSGQANGEAANRRYVGTIGGHTDFVRATQMAKRGRSIIALPSRVGETGPSRIVTALSGGVITAARADADTIVTEFGIAELRGQTVDERARRLIDIAHPDFREELSRAVRDLLGV